MHINWAFSSVNEVTPGPNDSDTWKDQSDTQTDRQNTGRDKRMPSCMPETAHYVHELRPSRFWVRPTHFMLEFLVKMDVGHSLLGVGVFFTDANPFMGQMFM